jgi:molybdate transport system substrate-binding protein
MTCVPPPRGTGLKALLGIFVGIGVMGVGFSASLGYAGMVVIAATPEVADEVEAMATTFEAANPGDRVRIAIASEEKLKGSAEGLPVQFFVSDNPAFIQWLEARQLVTRANTAPRVQAPLAVIGPPGDGQTFDSSRDFIHRLQQRGITIAIPDPAKTNDGHHARALLDAIGITPNAPERIILAANGATVLRSVKTGKAHYGILFKSAVLNDSGFTIHAESDPNAFSPLYVFAIKRGQQDHPAGKRFLAFMISPEGQQAFKAKGYNLSRDSQPQRSAWNALLQASSTMKN